MDDDSGDDDRQTGPDLGGGGAGARVPGLPQTEGLPTNPS